MNSIVNSIILDLIEILKDNCPHSLKNTNNFSLLYGGNCLLYNLHCYYDVDSCEYKLCKSCREILDFNINKSVFFKYITRINNINI